MVVAVVTVVPAIFEINNGVFTIELVSVVKAFKRLDFVIALKTSYSYECVPG